MTPSNTRVLEMFAGTRRNPRVIFTLLGKLATGLLYKTAEDIWPRKIKTKVDFFQASGSSDHSAVWRCSSPQGRLANTCSLQDFQTQFLSHFFHPVKLTCSGKRVSQLTMNRTSKAPGSSQTTMKLATPCACTSDLKMLPKSCTL